MGQAKPQRFRFFRVMQQTSGIVEVFGSRPRDVRLQMATSPSASVLPDMRQENLRYAAGLREVSDGVQNRSDHWLARLGTVQRTLGRSPLRG